MKVPENNRHNFPFIPFVPDDATGGFFLIPHPELRNYYFSAIANCGGDWEHVCVTVYPHRARPDRSCIWEEMCFIKSLFWEDEQTVMQLHPMKSEYINNHPHCLHLWRPVKGIIPTPPSILIGLKEFNI